MKNPADDWTEENPISNWDETQGDHHLHLDFDGNDFNELHIFLDIKLPLPKQPIKESFVEHQNRIKFQYLNAAKERGYEMLGRIWYWYESVSYFPNEIDQLLEECRLFKDNAQNAAQLKAAEKLITACNEAITIASGIFLGSD